MPPDGGTVTTATDVTTSTGTSDTAFFVIGSDTTCGATTGGATASLTEITTSAAPTGTV